MGFRLNTYGILPRPRNYTYMLGTRNFTLVFDNVWVCLELSNNPWCPEWVNNAFTLTFITRNKQCFEYCYELNMELARCVKFFTRFSIDWKSYDTNMMLFPLERVDLVEHNFAFPLCETWFRHTCVFHIIETKNCVYVISKVILRKKTHNISFALITCVESYVIFLMYLSQLPNPSNCIYISIPFH